MKTIPIALLLAVALASAAETITNDDVVRMAKAGLSPDTIEMKIRYSDTSFDTSTDALIALKSAGVTDATIRMMIEKQKDTPVAAKPPEPKPSPAPEPAKAESAAATPAAATAEPTPAPGPAPTPEPSVKPIEAPAKAPATKEAPRSLFEVGIRNAPSGATCSSGFLKLDANGLAATGCLGLNFQLTPEQIEAVCVGPGSSASIRLTTAGGVRELSAATTEMRDEIVKRMKALAPDLDIKHCSD